MASGRFGSAKILPGRSALIYDNTSGLPASVNVQATALSSTSNTDIGLAIDSATVSLNQTSTATTIAAGSVSQQIYWLDPLSNTDPLKIDFITNQNESNTGNYPISYWDGTTFTKPASGYYGAMQPEKVDPYFLTNPTDYGKTKASLFLPFMYNTTAANRRYRNYTLTSLTGTQFRNLMLHSDPGSTAYTVSFDNTTTGYGGSSDMYSDWMISQTAGSNSYIYNVGAATQGSGAIWTTLTGGAASASTVQHYWYAPRVMGSNGLFLFQATGVNTSVFGICDPDYALTLGLSLSAAIANAPTASAAWWQLNASSSVNQVSWFVYDPATQRYYFEYIPGNRIYSISRSELRALANRGTSGSYAVSTVCRVHNPTPWRTAGAYAMQPIRLAKSLWWTVSSASIAYVSTNLIDWDVATTYFPAQSYPASTFHITPLANAAVPGTSIQYLYMQNATANISRFNSGYGSVSDSSVIEFDTTINNYQRTGIVLNAGDKLYAQNYGSVAVSVTAMGYEGS